MVRVGIFGTTGELDERVIHVLVEELLNNICERMGSDKVDAVISYASGRGVGRYAFEVGNKYGAATVGVVLPSIEEEEVYPVDQIVYVHGEDPDQSIDDFSTLVDIIVWVGDIDLKRDWLEVATAANVPMLAVSDYIADWTAPSSNVDLGAVVDALLYDDL